MDWRGFLDEPYCSMGCKLLAGSEAIRATMNAASGDCAVCGTTVTASPTIHRATIVYFRGAPIFVCADDTAKGRELVAAEPLCSRCGATLD